MGRPPKKRLREDDALLPERPSELVDFHLEFADFSSPVFLSESHGLLSSEGLQNTWYDVTEFPVTPSILLPDGFSGPEPITGLDSGTISTGTTECPCLSYIYLYLSNMSTLSSFPVSVNTINTLCAAARTTRSVLACDVCPRQFATATQNVMMLGTLLTVLADVWLRAWLRADAVELGKHIATPASITSMTSQGPHQTDANWKQWLRRLICHFVMGGPRDEYIGSALQARPTPDILTLIQEMEERQRRWHAEGINQRLADTVVSDHSISLPTEESEHCQYSQLKGKEEDHLCLKIISNVRKVIHRFGFEPYEYSNPTKL